jgi:hypothetical protein
MVRFTGECAHFSCNKCPIYTHDGASAKYSTTYTKRITVFRFCLYKKLFLKENGPYPQGADPPLSSHVAKANRNNLNEEITPFLGEWYNQTVSQTTSKLGQAALLRRCELPLYKRSAELTMSKGKYRNPQRILSGVILITIEWRSSSKKLQRKRFHLIYKTEFYQTSKTTTKLLLLFQLIHLFFNKMKLRSCQILVTVVRWLYFCYIFLFTFFQSKPAEKKLIPKDSSAV